MIFWVWAAFIVFVIVMLAIDLGLINRKAHVISVRQALMWTGVCALLAVGFSAVVYYLYEHHVSGLGVATATLEARTGEQAALEYLTGWVIEQSLSLDNVFVIALIFSFFKIPGQYQHRVLFWGILGALIMRGVMIGAGAILIQKFAWMTYVFGGVLLLTAAKMFFTKEADIDPEKNRLVILARKLYPVTPHLEGQKFFTRYEGRRAITPLFLVLLVVESTDVVFAVDSIPAIFAITKDPFLVFTSNVFAILCLRSMYFALAGMMDKFRFLKISLVFVLGFVGVKMILAAAYHDEFSFGFKIPTMVSLAVIGAALVIGVAASLLIPRSATETHADRPPNQEAV